MSESRTSALGGGAEINPDPPVVDTTQPTPSSEGFGGCGVGILHRVGWVLVGLLAFWLWSDPPQWLACRCCWYGPLKYQVVGIGYGLIALRSAVAVALRERSPGWIVQLGLLVFLAPLVMLVVAGVGGH